MTNKGLISKEEQDQLKQLYKNQPLFKWTSPNKKDDVIFKAINLSLMNKINELIKLADGADKPIPVKEVNEVIFDECVIWPSFSIEEKELLPVGTIPSIVKIVQEKSGFLDIDVFNRILGPDQYSIQVNDYDYWPDPTEDELKKLKEKTKFQLHRARIGRWVFIVRPMTRTDLQIASAGLDEHLTLSKAITVWPETVDWDVIPAGIIERLSGIANEISGWSTDSSVEEI